MRHWPATTSNIQTWAQQWAPPEKREMKNSGVVLLASISAMEISGGKRRAALSFSRFKVTDLVPDADAVMRMGAPSDDGMVMAMAALPNCRFSSPERGKGSFCSDWASAAAAVARSAARMSTLLGMARLFPDRRPRRQPRHFGGVLGDMIEAAGKDRHGEILTRTEGDVTRRHAFAAGQHLCDMRPRLPDHGFSAGRVEFRTPEFHQDRHRGQIRRQRVIGAQKLVQGRQGALVGIGLVGQ